jgi:hypothetical protein
MLRWLGYFWQTQDAPHGVLSTSALRYWLLRATRERT